MEKKKKYKKFISTAILVAMIEIVILVLVLLRPSAVDGENSAFMNDTAYQPMGDNNAGQLMNDRAGGQPADSSKEQRAAMVSYGVNYIKDREKQDANSIENRLTSGQLSTIFAGIEENLENDPDYVWTALSQIGTVFMGDSRTAAYESYGFVEDRYCLGDPAMSIDIIPDHYEELKAANPKLLVIGYGLNDIGKYWNNGYEWADELMGYIDTIQGFLPECRIYVQSTIIPREALNERWIGAVGLSQTWNEQAQEELINNGYHVIDVGELVEYYSYMFLEDGVHLEADFYPHLAKWILLTYMSDMMQEQYGDNYNGEYEV